VRERGGECGGRCSLCVVCVVLCVVVLLFWVVGVCATPCVLQGAQGLLVCGRVWVCGLLVGAARGML
jgi:hypothetical protein